MPACRVAAAVFRRVLVGTDLSECAAAALAFARRLAPGAAFRLVHVVPSASALGVMGDDLVPLENAMRRTAEDARIVLEEVARRLGPGTEIAVPAGGVAAELAREAQEWGADLVVVGARGHSKVHDLLLGSVARTVVRRVRGNVLVVRADVPVKVVAAGTDLSEPADKAVETARGLANAHGAALVVFHAADSAMWGEAEGVRARAPPEARNEEAVEAVLRGRVEKRLAEHGVAARVVVAAGRPVETGARVVGEVAADVLVLGDHGPGAVERVFLGSVAEGLAERAPCNVLVAR